MTIASACNIVFRKLFLKPDTIGVIPHKGYRAGDKQSNIALKWLRWIAVTRQINITHKLNSPTGEVRVGPYKVDGISGQTIYEFNGCYWHGCIWCMPFRTQKTPDRFSSAQEAYERTQYRLNYLRQQGYNVVEMWECQLKRQLKSDPIMAEFFEQENIQEPLNPRDAFYGGSTNAIKLYHKTNEGHSKEDPDEKISYIDVCSLYPYVNKYGKYPIGHPKIITENFQQLTKDNRPYEGVIKCEVLPPISLYHPILPYRACGKLMFPLCRTCAETTNKEICHHEANQRVLKGTWVTDELYKALDLGYKV